jgi:transglutaminase-like putative cysteine protease
MKNLCFFPFLLLFLAIAPRSFCQSSKIRSKPPKAWVSEITFDKLAVPPAGQEEGFYYLLIDEQENAIQQESFTHYAYKILTNEGLQQMADLSVSFDPSYQQLIFHAVSIHRDGVVINQLPKDIRTIQREQSMDRFIYDGSMTAVINLTDVRIGDIIEYSFTKKGHNPVYQGAIVRKLYFDYNTGFEKSVQRITVLSSYKLTIKHTNTTLKPEIQHEDGLTTYTWTANKVKGVITDTNVPDWYDPYQQVSITDFENWSEVATWAAQLFHVSEADKQAIEKDIAPKFDGASTSAYALQVVRFVQDDIRYLGFETGLNSHKPHAPMKVYNQRFGDCKDKSLLLATLLEAKGIEARPVLVSTIYREKISDQLPSAQVFNHCVVQVKLDGEIVYIDPTINNQGGKLSNYYFPTYGKGLVIDPNTTDFVSFPLPATSSISEIQTFDLPSIGGEGILSVRTTYTGVEADIVRSQFSSSNLEEIQKNYLTFYGNLYPDIEKLETIRMDDDREQNVLSISEKYKIPSFWKVNSEQTDITYCEFYPQSLEGYFNVTKSSQRTAPYPLQYPLDYYHEIFIKTPEEWTMSPGEVNLESEYYEYQYSTRYQDKEIQVSTHYRTKESYVPVTAFAAFTQDHEKMMSNLAYTLTYNKSMADAASKKWPGVVMSLLALGFGAWLVLWLYHNYDPQPHDPTVEGEPIGGWLILIAIGLTLTPFRLIYDLITNPETVNGEAWLSMLLLERYGLFVFLVLEHIYNIVYLLFSVLVIVLFYQRRSSAPRLISILYGVTCIVTILDTIVSLQIDQSVAAENNFYNDMIKSIIAAAIWIPYFNISTRVKSTFVYVLRDKNDDPEQGELMEQPVPSGGSPFQ